MRGILLTACAAAAAAPPISPFKLQSSELYLPLSLSLLAERGILSIMWTMIYLSGLDPTSLKYTGLGLADRIRLGKPNKTPSPFKFFLNRPLTYFSSQLDSQLVYKSYYVASIKI